MLRILLLLRGAGNLEIGPEKLLALRCLLHVHVACPDLANLRV